MLEALAAFAVACNIIQVVETGCDLAIGTYKRIKDGSELSTEHLRLQDISKEIKELSAELEDALSKAPSDTRLSKNVQQLTTANQVCLRISKEFIALLDRLTVKQAHAIIENVRKSFKAYFHRGEVESIRKALAEARDNLSFAVLLYINAQMAVNAADLQDSIQNYKNDLAGKIEDAIISSSNQTRSEIRQIAEDLRDAYLDPKTGTLSAFLTSNKNEIQALTQKLDSIYISQRQERDENLARQDSLAKQKILDSLRFPDMYQRYEQVKYAEKKTYQWMMKPNDARKHEWSCFYSWLQDAGSAEPIYWIQGKPGSGKSTLLKFVCENLDASTNMSNWRGDLPVYITKFFFWQNGGTLQKSLSGFYRAILVELLSQRLDLIPEVFGNDKWKTASLSGISPSVWKNSELKTALQRTIALLSSAAKVFIVMDGLDECNANEQEDHLELVKELSAIENLKMCVSSRPWNIFQDELGLAPQLRLEDLTKNDMLIAVTASFERNSRWKRFSAGYPEETQALIKAIVGKARGVFLWVTLVVRDLLQGLRDGDSVAQLEQKLDQIPGDLDDYFKRMIDSIEPKYRKEASKMLQVACFQETEFISSHEVRLLQLSFVEEQDLDFATHPDFNMNMFDLNRPDNVDRLRFRVDSTLRKLHSRCKGLLECTRYGLRSSRSTDSNNTVTVVDQVDVTNIEEVFNLRVDLIHKSLREFLSSPQMRDFLHLHTNGPFNARRFLCNARLVQFMTLATFKPTMKKALGFAGNIVPTLSVRGADQWSSAVFSVMQPHLMRLAKTCKSQLNYSWYITASLETLENEYGNDLTLAIDFNLTSYVLASLSTEGIRAKPGRPILDYILRPRFLSTPEMTCGYHWPDIVLLKTALDLGADPNEEHGTRGVTIWESFLCLWAEGYRETWYYDFLDDQLKCQSAFTEALIVLLKAGAHPILELRVLGINHPYGRYMAPPPRHKDQMSRFNANWPGAKPIDGNFQGPTDEQLYRVSSLLKTHSLFQGPEYDELFKELKSLEDDYLKKHIISKPPTTTEYGTPPQQMRIIGSH